MPKDRGGIVIENRSQNQRPNKEDALLMRLRGGDELAFDYFVHKFYPLILLFSQRILADRLLAEDVTQEVFYKLWENKGNYSSVKSLRAFLYVAARNACFNWLDKNRNRSKFQEDYAHLRAENEVPIIHEIIRSEVLAELSGAIDALPPQCRQIIRMIFVDEKKPKEIADELGITLSTVNNQKSRGIRLLKKLFGQERFDLLLFTLTLLGK